MSSLTNVTVKSQVIFGLRRTEWNFEENPAVTFQDGLPRRDEFHVLRYFFFLALILGGRCYHELTPKAEMPSMVPGTPRAGNLTNNDDPFLGLSFLNVWKMMEQTLAEVI